MQAVIVSAPTYGQVTYNGDGTFAYAAPDGWTGTDTFSFQGIDGIGASNVATVTINVTQYASPNADGSYGVLANQTLPGIDFSQNDSDAHGDPTQIAIVSGPSNGTLTENSDGTYDYTPDANYIGADQITVSANGGSPVSVTINVTDEPPIAFSSEYNVNNNGTFTVSPQDGVLANCIDSAGNPFNAALVSGPEHGSLTLNADGSFLYAPDPTFVGTDSFVFDATDGILPGNQATVTLDVTADTPPSAGDTSFSVHHDQTLTVSSPGLSEYISDTDGAALTVALVNGPSNGALTLNPDGTFTYTPDSGFVGTDTFSYEAYDGIYDSPPATVTISVTDSAPLAAAMNFSTPAGQTLTVTASNGVLLNAFDLNGDPMAAQLVSTTANGSLTLNSDGSFAYTPNAGFTGNDVFAYEVSDGIMVSTPVTATITVSGDVPVANDFSFATSMDTPLTISGPGILANDPAVGGAQLSAVLSTAPSNGTISLNSDGSFTYTPYEGFTGTDSYTYYVEAGLSQSPTVGTVQITVVTASLPLPQAQWTQGPWVFLDAGDYNGSAWQSSSTSMSVAGAMVNGTTFRPTGNNIGYLVPGLVVTGKGLGIPANTTISAVNTSNNTITHSQAMPAALRGNMSLQFSNPTSVNIPRVRDYSSTQQLPNNRTDPLLLPVPLNLNFAIPVGATGFVQLQAQSAGTGQISLWSDQRKTTLLGGTGLNSRNFPLAGAGALPSTIYVEGTSATSVFLNGLGMPTPDCTITLSLWILLPGAQAPMRIFYTQATVGVSPVVQNYTITTAQPQGFIATNPSNFRDGLSSAGPGVAAQANQAARFSGQVYDPNAPAQSKAQFVQTITMQNTPQLGGGAQAFFFLANTNRQPQAWRWLVNGQVSDGGNVMDDLAQGPGPFYNTNPAIATWATSTQYQNAPVYQISNTDSPQMDKDQLAAIGLANGLRNGASIVNAVGFAFNFIDYLVWQMPVLAGSGPLAATGDNRPATVIFTLATDSWYFLFHAWSGTMIPPNLNTIANTQFTEVVAGTPTTATRTDPKITGPSGNSSINIG